ncbi:hypothetical protein PAPYR_11819 [Paratrimastix pyriformis]|uniref:Uncharacterized protein n=1 Tax=Paratrimastix pyriformis TaxID=342808 RepID=A0ABQ8U5G5_9EUKA|nr:hypothetical protein PAPYR_11819 [Paratrimastix pyriformis]
METMCVNAAMSPTLALLPVGKLLSANSVAVEKADLSLGQFAGARLSAAPAPPVPDVPRPAPPAVVSATVASSPVAPAPVAAAGTPSAPAPAALLPAAGVAPLLPAAGVAPLLPAAGVASGAAAPALPSPFVQSGAPASASARASSSTPGGAGVALAPHSPALGLALDGPRLALFARGLASLLEEGLHFPRIPPPPAPFVPAPVRLPADLESPPHQACGRTRPRERPSADSSDEESSASSVPSLEFLGESTPVYESPPSSPRPPPSPRPPLRSPLASQAPNALTLAAYLARNPLRSSSAGLVSTPPLVGEPAAAPPSRFAGGPPAVSATCTPLPAAPLLAGVPPVATATCTPVPSGCAFGLPSSQLGQGGALSSAPACGSLLLPPGTSPEVALLFRLMEERFAALAAQTGGAAVVPPGVLPPAKESYKDYLRRVGVPEDRGSLTPFVPHFPLAAAVDLAEFGGATVNLSTVPPDVVARARELLVAAIPDLRSEWPDEIADNIQRSCLADMLRLPCPRGFPLGAPLTPPEECARGGETADAQRRREVDSRRIRTHVQFLLLKARGLELTRLGLKGLEAALPGRWLRRWDPTCSRLRNLWPINAEASTETNKLRKIWAAVVSWSKLKAWIAKKLSERSLYADQPAVQAKLPDPARLLWAPEVVAAQLDGQKATVEGDKVERSLSRRGEGSQRPFRPRNRQQKRPRQEPHRRSPTARI